MLLVYHAYNANPRLAAAWSLQAEARYRGAGLGDEAFRLWSTTGSEETTLKRVWHMAQEPRLAADRPVLYWHTKGITRPGVPAVADWTELLTYWCVDRWRDAVAKLKAADVVGCNLASEPEWHFSGNFWWTTIGHLRKLEEPQYGRPRFAAEAWIAHRRRTRLATLFDSQVNHYDERFPPDRYVGRTASERTEVT